MISTTNVVCMKSKLREVVVSTKLTLLKVLAQRFINIGSRTKGTSAPWFCTQRKDFLDFLWYGLLRLKVIVHGVCKSKTSKSHLSSRSHITYLEISLEQTSKESQENSLLDLIPYSSIVYFPVLLKQNLQLCNSSSNSSQWISFNLNMLVTNLFNTEFVTRNSPKLNPNKLFDWIHNYFNYSL